MRSPLFPIAALAGALLLGVPLGADAQTTARGMATIHIPEMLSFELVEETRDGVPVPVVVVTANSDWRLLVRAGDESTILEGPAGRGIRRVLPEGSVPLEVTLAAF